MTRLLAAPGRMLKVIDIDPRVVEATDKEFTFELYLPAAAAPYREALFKVKDLVYRGKPEM